MELKPVKNYQKPMYAVKAAAAAAAAAVALSGCTGGNSDEPFETPAPEFTGTFIISTEPEPAEEPAEELAAKPVTQPVTETEPGLVGTVIVSDETTAMTTTGTTLTGTVIVDTEDEPDDDEQIVELDGDVLFEPDGEDI